MKKSQGIIDYCSKCGKEFCIDNQELFDYHHPNKKDNPSETILLCKDCHYMEHHNVKEINIDIMSEGYGILPNKVLFDSELSSTAKLLYTLISSLCAKKGYCFASNKYLSEKLKISTVQISKLTTSLEKYLSFENRTSVIRKIYLNTDLKQKFKVPQTKVKGDLKQKFKHNSISKDYNNNILPENKNFQDTQEEIKLEPNTKEKVQRLKAKIAKLDPSVNFGSDYQADGKKPKKKRQLSGWQLVYNDLVDWFQKEYKVEVIGRIPQYEQLKKIRKLESMSNLQGEEFSAEIKKKMGTLAKEDWHNNEFDFKTLVSQWHKLKEQKVWKVGQ